MAAKAVSLKSRLKRRPYGRSRVGNLLNFLVLAGVGVVMALPMVYAVSSAFKPLDELFLFPPRFLVRQPTWDNFSDLFRLMSSSWVPFTRYMFNTLLLAVLATAGNVVVCSMAAYMLEKRKFPGSGLMYHSVVLALMFSGAVTAIPNYLIMAEIGWIDTYFALIVPAFATPIGLFLMKQFMGVVHDSLIESAKLDGANEWQIFWRIVMPIVRPAWQTLIIFSFQSTWNMTGGTFIFSEELKTLPSALNQVLQGGIARTGVSCAVALLIMIIPIAVFIASESQVLETMGSSGIKE